MRLAFLGLAVALVGGAVLYPVSASADRAADRKACLNATEDDGVEVWEACDRFLEASGTSKKDQAAAYAARARLAAAEMDFDSALDDIDAAIKLVPSNATFYFDSGRYLLEIDEIEDAIDDFNRSIKLDRTRADSYFMRGKAYYAKGEEGDADAMDDFDRAIELEPEHAEAYLYRGRIYDAYYQTEDAIREYNSALEYVESAEAYVARGWAYVDNGEARKAVADLNEALHNEPLYDEKDWNDYDVYPHLADAYLALGEYDEAIKALTVYLEVYSNAVAEYRRRGGAYAGIQDWQAAAEYRRRGDAYAGKQDWQAAIADFSRAIELTEGADDTPFTARGKAYRSAGDFQNALADFDKVLEKYPAAASAHLDLAKTYTAMNDKEKARAEYEAAVAAATATLEKHHGASLEKYINHARGLAYAALGEHQKAIDDYTKGLSDTNDEFDDYGLRADFHTDRAASYEALGDTVRAASDHAEAARLKEAEFARQNASPGENPQQ